LSYNAEPKDYEEAMQIRYMMEKWYSLDYAVKIRRKERKRL